MIKLKYKGKLGYLEARYRLGLGDRDALLVKINALKASMAGDIISIAKDIFEIDETDKAKKF